MTIPTPPPTYFSNLPDVAAARRTLEELSAGATSAEYASQRCQQTLQDVQKLLNADGLSQFQFKVKKIPQLLNSKSEQQKIRPRKAAPKLSHFAQMVLDNTDVSYRYLTAESPEPRQHDQHERAGEKDQRNGSHGVVHPMVAIPSAPQHASQLLPPYDARPPPGSQDSHVNVVVPTSKTPAQRAEGQDHLVSGTAVASTVTPSRRRETGLVNGYRGMTVDQKTKSDMAVLTIENLLVEISEAESQLLIDVFGSAFDTEDGPKNVLQPHVQARLDGAVQKAIANGRFEDVNNEENWERIQKLCEPAISEASLLSLYIGEGWSESDAEEWAQRIVAAERSATAARTMLRIMAAGAHAKQLQSEDYLGKTLKAISTILESCVVPIVEDRPSSQERGRGAKGESTSATFAIASTHRVHLHAVLTSITKTIRAVGDFITKCDADETALSRIESFCKLLIFAENASNDRDSVLGVQSFENLRRSAMDVLAKEFAKYPNQQQYILDQILTTLDKLPSGKQSARQYRLQDAKPIQLVSALLMRLVQTSATFGGQSTSEKSKEARGEDADEEESDEDAEGSEEGDAIRAKPGKPQQPKDLPSLVRPLHEAAQKDASYIVTVLLQKAVTSTKSGDEPYRKLLDIFTEDFLNVLGSSDWPAAELLLRNLAWHMINMVEDSKYGVGAKTLALELLGTIGTGILDIQTVTRNMARDLDTSDSELSQRLVSLFGMMEAGENEYSALVAFDGPYRTVVEYIQARDLKDSQLRSAVGYQLMLWAYRLIDKREGSMDPGSGPSAGNRDLQNKLYNMILDLQWLEDHHDYDTVAKGQGRLAAMLVTLSSQLCKAFNRISQVLTRSMQSDQPKVKSRALKSVVALLEKDPSILDSNDTILAGIFRCATDTSPLVRDSAIMLIADCVKLRPALSKAVYQQVVARSCDASTGVRKRAMKLLKDLYLGTQSTTMRAAIADALIARMQDTEESVVDLARQTIEDVWFTPFLGLQLDGEGALEARLKYSDQTALLIRTVESSDETGTILEGLIRQLVAKSKTQQAHINVCRNFIRLLSDGIIDSSDITGSPSQPSIFRCLAVLAKACPKLFTAAQLERLEPYTQNVTGGDNLDIYRSSITILRHVVPHQSALRNDFLQSLQSSLMSSVSKLPQALHEIVPCLWTIDSMLGNRDRLVKLVASALRNVYNMRQIDSAADGQAVTKISRLMVIIGHFGHVCDFEENLAAFKDLLPWYKGETVTGLMAEVLCPLTSPKLPLTVRTPALEALCMICQTWPDLLLRKDIVNSFETVFHDRDADLGLTLLHGLKSFFAMSEESTNSDNVPALGTGIASGTERLSKTYQATAQDGATTTIAQRFLADVLRIALTATGEPAYVASKIIVSINRQGLVHPKESGPALVALETSPNTALANVAFVEHKAQHAKHESLFDKEYMRAVQQAFEYQRDTIKDARGVVGRPPVSKLHLLWEVLKTGKAQVRKKFLSNLAQKLDFTLTAADTGNQHKVHLAFVRFSAENLAFFDYEKVEELLHLLDAMEKTFARTGTTVAQAIESELLYLRTDAGTPDPAPKGRSDAARTEHAQDTVSPARLLQLATAAQICSLVWETRSFIRRLWNLQKYYHKGKGSSKESNRSATRATNAPTLVDAYLKRVAEIMGADATLDSQRAVCASFVELISVDSEVKIASDEEENIAMEDGYDTPSEATSRRSPSVANSGGKKRKSINGPGATPRKRGRPSGSGRTRSGSVKLDEDEDGWG